MEKTSQFIPFVQRRFDPVYYITKMATGESTNAGSKPFGYDVYITSAPSRITICDDRKEDAYRSDDEDEFYGEQQPIVTSLLVVQLERVLAEFCEGESKSGNNRPQICALIIDHVTLTPIAFEYLLDALKPYRVQEIKIRHCLIKFNLGLVISFLPNVTDLGLKNVIFENPRNRQSAITALKAMENVSIDESIEIKDVLEILHTGWRMSFTYKARNLDQLLCDVHTNDICCLTNHLPKGLCLFMDIKRAFNMRMILTSLHEVIIKNDRIFDKLYLFNVTNHFKHDELCRKLCFEIREYQKSKDKPLVYFGKLGTKDSDSEDSDDEEESNKDVHNNNSNQQTETKGDKNTNSPKQIPRSPLATLLPAVAKVCGHHVKKETETGDALLETVQNEPNKRAKMLIN